MKLSDLIDRIEYISDDNGSIKSAEIRETSEDGKILNLYCSRRMNLSNLVIASDDFEEEEINELLIDVPCRIKLHLNEVFERNLLVYMRSLQISCIYRRHEQS